MNEQETMADHEVATWLRNHPDFLHQFPEIAMLLTMPRQNDGTTSLASYQLDVLRDKNRELNRRLREFLANSQENEHLAVRTHRLVLALMVQRTAAETVQTMAASLAEDFQVDWVKLVLFSQIEGLQETPWLRYLPENDEALQPFHDVLASGEPLCGRLNPDKNTLLYADEAAEVQSSALLALPGIGLIAVGSRDPNRFFPGMGTLFLRMMGEAFAAALGRWQAAA